MRLIFSFALLISLNVGAVEVEASRDYAVKQAISQGSTISFSHCDFLFRTREDRQIKCQDFTTCLSAYREFLGIGSDNIGLDNCVFTNPWAQRQRREQASAILQILELFE